MCTLLPLYAFKQFHNTFTALIASHLSRRCY